MINVVVLPAGDPFETFNLAIAFPPDAPRPYKSCASDHLVVLPAGSVLGDYYAVKR
jgi:hypothetical protein